MGTIYMIKNQINQKCYIGQTSRSPETRWKEHLRDSSFKDTALYRAMKKYGVENFQFSILEENLPIEDLSQKEQFYIKKYNSYHNGYNMTYGGEGFPIIDPVEIYNLFDKGYNIAQISEITGYNKKSISSYLKEKGYKITAQNQRTNVKVVFEGETYSSIAELARFLKENNNFFKNRKIKTIINGISKALKYQNGVYLGFLFAYENQEKNLLDFYTRKGVQISFEGKTYNSIKELVHFLKNNTNYFPKTSEKTLMNKISKASKDNKDYLGFRFYRV